MQMAPHSVIPNQHERPDRIHRRLADLLRCRSDRHIRHAHHVWWELRSFHSGGGVRHRGCVPIAADNGCRPWCPTGALLFGQKVLFVVAEAFENVDPFGIDRTWVLQVTGVHLRQIRLIGAVKVGSALEI